jgi:hypothetical protein
MANKVDELYVEIKGDVSDLLSKLKEATNETKTSTEKMSLAFKGLSSGISAGTKALGTFGLAVQGAKSALEPFNYIINKLNDASGLKRTADRLGVNVERFQEFAHAARMAGANTEDLYDSMKDLNVRITDAANGAKSYEEILNKVGLSSKELVSLPMDEQIRMFADAVSKANSEMQIFAVDELMSDPGLRMMKVWRGGAKAIDEAAEALRAMNGVITEQQFEDIEKAVKEINKMKSAWDALATTLVAKVAPQLERVFKAINDIATGTTPEPANNRPPATGSILKREMGTEDDVFASIREIMMRQRKEGKLPLPSGGGGIGGGISFGGVSDEEENQAIDDIGKILGLNKSSAEALKEAMEFQQENLDWQVEAHQTAQDAIRNLTLQRINDELKAEQDKADAEEKLRKLKIKASKDMLSNLSSLMNTESRKMFEVGKAAAAAQATMNTYEGANKAMAQGGIWGWAQAAAIMTAGFNNVNNILSTSFGGAGGGAASTGGAAGLGSDGSTTEAPSVQTTNFDVTLQGDSFSGDQVRGLIGQINEATDDGVKLNAVMVR